MHRIAFVLNFEHLNFGFVSDFDIRISNFHVLISYLYVPLPVLAVGEK